MFRLDMVLLNIKLLTAVVAGILAVISSRSYRRGSARSMALLSVGLGAISLGAAFAVLGGFAIGFVDTVWLVESAFLLAGIGLVLASVWVE